MGTEAGSDLVEKKRMIGELLKKNILVSPEFLAAFLEEGAELPPSQAGLLVVDHASEELLKRNDGNVNWLELERSKAAAERQQKPEAYDVFTRLLLSQSPIVKQPGQEGESSVRVVFSYDTIPAKREVSDFVSYYAARYKAVQAVLLQRAELSGLVQISRLRGSPVSESVSVIGMVTNKETTKNGHILLTLEDQTGIVKVIVSKARREIHELASDIVFDEVIAVNGGVRDGTLFAANITFPDIPHKEPKRSPREGYAAFMSDLHFGSAQFLEEEFRRFLKWMNGGLGNQQQREMASKVKYVIIAGDVVDGVGVYQDQYDELSVKDVQDQYKLCADYLSEIPGHVKIIISPGNHDAVRAAEPQTAFSGDFAAPLLKLPNLIPVSNPGIVNIDASEGFPGFDVLIYHGYSFDYYVANVDSIRRQGGYERADLIMKFLLQRRHLAPAHTSTLILPDQSVDPLFIGTVPDIFATGHIHRTSVSDYKGVALINSSCWQGLTKFQERMGHTPQPSRVPVFNLKTRATKIINFGK